MDNETYEQEMADRTVSGASLSRRFLGGKIFIFLVLMFKLAGGDVMASGATTESQRPKQWLLFWAGDWRFGHYGISVNDSGRARLTLFNTANDESANGAGVIEAPEAQYDRAAAERVRLALCNPSSQAGRGLQVIPTDPATTFSVACEENGAIVRRDGNIKLLPKDLFDQATENARLVHIDLLLNGTKKIWINASVIDIVRKDGNFLVTIRMTNSGRESIAFKRPDLWSGNDWEETLSLGAINTDPAGKGGWRFSLAGRPLENKNDFGEELVRLQAGQYRDFVFRARPDGKYAAGTYAFAMNIWMDIAWKDGEHEQHSHIDFFSGEATRKIITIDRDYPSTPLEREQWEKDHRENMSQWPVKPGATFAEDGLYRAIRTNGGYRGLLLKPFKAGDIATTEPVTMPMDSHHADDYIQGAVQWLWEASAPTPVKQWSLDLVDGTQHDCEPGAVCPRSGRWVPRVMSGVEYASMEYEYRPAGIVTRCLGDVMPPIRGTQARWEWIGSVA